MKLLNLTLSVLITLTAGLSSAAVGSKGSKKHDFTQSIKSARAQEKDLFKSFQAEIKAPKVETADQEEVVEFLNSEIRWKAPKKNASN